jgi:hypothetical protein
MFYLGETPIVQCRHRNVIEPEKSPRRGTQNRSGALPQIKAIIAIISYATSSSSIGFLI